MDNEASLLVGQAFAREIVHFGYAPSGATTQVHDVQS